MQKILDAFQSLFDLFGVLLGFIQTLIDSLLKFVAMIPSCIEMLLSAVAYLPSEVIVFATLSISVSVIFLLVGRGRTN